MDKTKTEYDIAVIGGGIHGAGVLQAAAARGYSAVLLEQSAEPAMATSSRSSKLIHGGLRYLETGQFKLVYECLQERSLLLKNAPGLVKLQPFHIPVYDDSSRGPLLLRIGLSLYSLLAGLNKSALFCTLPEQDWPQLNGLKTQGLRKVFRYADAQTDDKALTAAVLKSAGDLGAVICMNSRFISAQKVEQAYQLEYRNIISANNDMLRAKTIVNAAGPWANEVMKNITPSPPLPNIDLVQGTHIILPGNIGRNIYYLQAPDGRAVFVMPWQKQIMVGTTEQVFQGANPAETRPSDNEINYLLAIFNYYFPGFYSKGAATAADLIDSFAGLRVLPKNKKNPFKRSRETLFLQDTKRKPHLVAIYGGKLTSYRSTAEKAVAILAPQLPKCIPKADTRSLALGC